MRGLVRYRLHIGILTILLFAAGLGIVLLVFHGSFFTSSPSAAFASQFKQFIVPDITLGSTSYAVTGSTVTHDGKAVTGPVKSIVLRAAYFTIANRLDPVLALTGTDPVPLASAVAALQASIRSLAEPYPQNIRALITNDFYPISYLSRLPSLEKTRLAVLLHPSYANELDYSDQLLSTLAQYQADIHNSIVALTQLSATGSSTISIEYMFPGGFTTNAAMVQRLEALAADTNVASSKAAVRRNCLTGDTSACVPLIKLLPHINSTISNLAPPSVISPEEAATESLLLAAVQKDAAMDNETFTNIGVVALQKSTCTPSSASPLYMYLWRLQEPSSTTPSLRFEPITDMFFYDLHGSTDPFYTRLRKQGMSFLSQGISNYYECPDSGAEAMHVATTYALYQDAVTRPLFADKTFSHETSLMREASTEESALSKNAVMSEEAVSNYASTLSSLLATLGERALAHNTSTSTVYSIERRLAEFRDRSALVDQQIETAIAMNSIVPGINAVAAGTRSGLFQPLWLFLSRSYPSLFYLSANQSIASDSASFFSTASTVPLSLFHLTTLSSLQKNYSPTQIRQFLTESSRAYYRLGVRGL